MKKTRSKKSRDTVPFGNKEKGDSKFSLNSGITLLGESFYYRTGRTVTEKCAIPWQKLSHGFSYF